MSDARPGPHKAFTRYAWIFVGYMLLVILYGAWVRFTGSGAGCGANWPDCHGQLVPEQILSQNETLIEYVHRVTSGILGPMVLVLVGWAWKRFGNHRVFWASVITTVFVVLESLIGAGLVLGELVADNASTARAVVISIHLVNTLSLTASAALAAWWSTGKPAPKWSRGGALKWLLFVGLAGLVVTSVTGAITALGDTLFPTDPTIGEGMFARVRDDLSTTKHLLVRLRVIHPVVAIISALYLVALTWVIRLRDTAAVVEHWSNAVLAAVIAQTLLGVFNVLLSAPGWMQMLHLLVAQMVWISALFLTLSTMMPEDEGSEPQ